MSGLRLEGVSRSFGGVAALSDVSFAVPSARIFAIIGPNGAGKTTLFNLVSGVYQPTSGRIFLGDDEITGRAPHAVARAGIARTFQTPQVFFNMSALENVMVGAHRHLRSGILPAVVRIGGLAAAERTCRDDARRLMERIGLCGYLDAEASTLPYGAMKRLEIARALASRPRVLLLDEPAAGLNSSDAAEMIESLRAVAAAGVTVVLIEHNMRLVMSLAEHILVLVSGRRLTEGSPAEVQRHPEVIAAYLGATAAQHERRYA